MSVGEEDASFGETIDIRGEGLRVASHTADPVVEIINSDEEDVGVF